MDPTDVMHSCVLSMELLLYLAFAAHNRCEHMWLVRWITAPHLRLDLAVENANAKNVIFLSAQLLCGLHLHSMILGEPVQCY